MTMGLGSERGTRSALKWAECAAPAAVSSYAKAWSLSIKGPGATWRTPFDSARRADWVARDLNDIKALTVGWPAGHPRAGWELISAHSATVVSVYRGGWGDALRSLSLPCGLFHRNARNGTFCWHALG